MTKRILVVDDEISIGKLIKFNLEKEGFQVDYVSDGSEVLQRMREMDLPDLMVLDLMLPEVDGLEICKRLRQEKVRVPILMLTAKADEFDKVLGLELGADDYMTKPFSIRELTARVRAILRRMEPMEEIADEISVCVEMGDLRINPQGYECIQRGELVELTPKEFELLLYLVNHKGKVLTRDQLLNAVWNYDYIGDSRIVDVHVSHLRDKLEEDTKKPVYIKTVRGIGYKFEGPKEL